ncbi:NMT1/THI5 like-domain-containing protein [Chytridium lagenaria]|nr:NMT1/THI5 like-domain-containing protein [Chytridium lagenaria]
MSTDKVTLLLNWAANPYHAPIFLAQKLGYFEEEGVKIAILEPSDPSDVTEIIGSGKVDMGCKAMIHTIAAKARGFPVTSIGTLLDEPFTGVVYIKSNNTITEDFQSLRGRRIGYVGEFGKIIIDALTRRNGMTPQDYTAVRVGMNVADAIKRGVIDAGVGLENVQQVELEEWCKEQGRDASDVGILYIANDTFLQNNPTKVRAFLRAIHRSTTFMLANPQKAYTMYRSMPYFSKTLENVERDWNKVTNYCKTLGVCEDGFVQNMTNAYLPTRDEEEGKMDGTHAPQTVVEVVNSSDVVVR